MKKPIFFFLYICVPLFISGQKKLIIDLDGDSKNDTVYIEDTRIICRLSSQQFKKMISMEIEKLHFMSGIDSTETGFSFSNHRFRGGGYSMDFNYEPSTQKIRLVKMYRYEYGNPENYDGNGVSTLNLLTNEYTGDWQFYDYDKDTLCTIPTINEKMDTFNPIYLEEFSDYYYFIFADECATLWNTYADKFIENSLNP